MSVETLSIAEGSAEAAGNAAASARFRTWCVLVGLLAPAVALLAWASVSFGTAQLVPWTWVNGFLWPAPSLVWLWLAGAGIVAILSGVAWLLHTTPADARRLGLSTSIATIGLLALGARLAMIVGRGEADVAALLADAVAVAGFIWVLVRQQRSVWWALLYAMHPLVLTYAGAAASPNAMVAAAALLALTAPTGGTAKSAATWGGVILVGFVALVLAQTQGPAGCAGPVRDLFEHIFWQVPAGRVPAVCVVAGILAVAATLAVGYAARKPVGPTMTHALVIALFFLPTVTPLAVLLVLAAGIVWWNRAAWVLGVTGMALWAIPLAAGWTGRAELPDWLSILVWSPVVVVELHQLVADFRR